MGKKGNQQKNAGKSKEYLTLILMIVVVGVIIAAKFWIDSKGGLTFGSPGARSKGNPHANLKIVEYIDFECPACADGAVLLREYFKKYPDQIYLEMKYFPLFTMHRHAMMSARYAQCASVQNQFWPFHDRLIDRQKQWKQVSDARSAFEEIAKELEMDVNQLTKCVEDEKTEDVIMQEKEEGRIAGVKSTPTYFVNSKMIVGKDSLLKMLKEHFKE